MSVLFVEGSYNSRQLREVTAIRTRTIQFQRFQINYCDLFIFSTNIFCNLVRIRCFATAWLTAHYNQGPTYSLLYSAVYMASLANTKLEIKTLKLWNYTIAFQLKMFSRCIQNAVSPSIMKAGAIRLMSGSAKTLFEKIADKTIPSSIIFEDDKVRNGFRRIFSAVHFVM